MKRRTFLQQSTGLGIAQLSAPPAFSQITTGSAVKRTSRLFDLFAATRVHDVLIQDVLLVDDRIFCLHGLPKTTEWWVSATTPEGTKLWTHKLPSGFYSALGTSDSGTAVLAHAFSCTDSGIRRRNAIFRLLPEAGAIEFLGSTDITGSTARMFFAGDSFFVRFANNDVEIWSAGAEVKLEGKSSLNISPASAHVDCIGTGLVAITLGDGTSISTVSIPSGISQNFAIAAPEIAAAQAIIRHLASKNPVEPPNIRAASNIIGITGADRQHGLVKALLLPVRVGDPTPLIALDRTGNVTYSGSYEIKHNAGPIKLLTRLSELGVVYTDGSVAWHAA